MISEYQDMLAKTKFYKEKVLQSFIKQGYYPNNDEILGVLSDIDTRSALLDTYLSAKGSLFNTKEINYMFECIYKDLNILYEVLNEILINQYNKLKLDVEVRLVEMEQKVSTFKKRMDEEINTSVLGTTIFFKSNQWEPEVNDDTTVIPLTQMKLIQGSRIALFANIDNIDASRVYFNFEPKDESGTMFFGLPYNYNEDVYTVPGNLGINRYEVSVNERLNVNDSVELTIENVDYDNDYKIMAGKTMMKVTYKDDNTITYEAFASDNRSFQALRDCYIEFYMIDDTKISYNFNMAPNHANFSLTDNVILCSEQITKVFIDAPSGFVCNFNIENGEIWASCTDALIKNTKTIFYTGDWSLEDFLVLEFVRSNTSEYDISLVIKSDSDIIDNINNIYIKEVS